MEILVEFVLNWRFEIGVYKCPDPLNWLPKENLWVQIEIDYVELFFIILIIHQIFNLVSS